MFIWMRNLTVCLISIGLIAIVNDCVIDSYYSLIRPHRFHTLSKTVRRMTKLTDEEIKKAPDFRKVMNEINVFIKALNSPYELYTFGPDDVRQHLSLDKVYRSAKKNK